MIPVTTPVLQGSQGCTFSAASLTPPQTIDEGVSTIERVLAKDLLCMHDVEVLNHTYLALDRLEQQQGKIPERNSSTVLKMIADKVEAITKRSSDPQLLISFYYLQRFTEKQLRLADRYESFSQRETVPPLTEIAAHLSNCGTEEEFDRDVNVLIGPFRNDITEEVLYQRKIEATKKKWRQNGSSCVCPLTLGLITDPVLDEHGHCFERRAVVTRLKAQSVCPMNDKPLTEEQLIPNDDLKKQIDSYRTQGFSIIPREREDVPKPKRNISNNNMMASSFLSSAQGFERQQQFQEAEQFYSHMLDHTSRSEDYAHIPILFETNGKKERAAAAYVILADLKKAEGKLEEEIVSLQKSVTLTSNPFIKERLAIILYQKEQKETAAQLYLELAKQALYNRNKNQAERCCGEVLKIVPGSSEAWKLMAVIKSGQAAEILLRGAGEASMTLKERIGLCKVAMMKDPTQILARLLFLELDRIKAKNKLSYMKSKASEMTNEVIDLKQRIKMLELAPSAFGKAQWEKYFGVVGAEPPLPENIYGILNSPCPFWKEKKVHETHVLVLVPQTVNGRRLTLKNLGELVQKPLQGGHATNYNVFALGEYVDQPAKSHWALLTRTVIEGSRNKLCKDGKALLAQYSQKTNIVYEIPTVLDAAVCNFMEYVRSGTWLYGENPWTSTWCQEKYDAKYYLVVGGVSGSGLGVRSNLIANECNGVGGLRKL
jgi:tetratricopeptide (TPR) repeat protein